MISVMATRIRQSARPHWYITEHLREAGLSDQKAANRIGRDRATVYKWRKSPDRLDENQLRELASAIGPDFDYRKFHKLPESMQPGPQVESIDELIEDEPPEVREKAVEMIKLLVGRR